MTGLGTTSKARRAPVGGPSVRHARCRRGDEAGQSIVEMALILPFITLLIAIAFTGWNALQQTIRLTTATRSGAIKAANDLSGYIATNKLQCSAMVSGSTAWTNDFSQSPTPQDDATSAINAEEGVTNTYQDNSASSDNYVSLTSAIDNDAGVSVYVVTITISHQVATWFPFLSAPHVTATATARYC
jgi:Flp pilus assembly protein TadG